MSRSPASAARGSGTSTYTTVKQVSCCRHPGSIPRRRISTPAWPCWKGRSDAVSRVEEQYQEACRYLAGGVSASTRLNRAVGHPMLFDRAGGCRLWDLDGKEYLDLCCSHGATLLGHGDERVRRAVEGVLARGPARRR